MSPENVLVSVTVQPPDWKRWAAAVAVVLLVLFSTTNGSLPSLAFVLVVELEELEALFEVDVDALPPVEAVADFVGVVVGFLVEAEVSLFEALPVALAARRPCGWFNATTVTTTRAAPISRTRMPRAISSLRRGESDEPDAVCATEVQSRDQTSMPRRRAER